MARVELFARTEIGCVRERNEDAFIVANANTGERGLRPATTMQELGQGMSLIGVCDGMGGAAAGDIASKIGTETLYDAMMMATPLQDQSGAQEALLSAIATANRAILDYARNNPGKRGMGTTMTAALIYGHDIYVVHIGDSRAYLRRGRTLTQLTTDHSIVGQMIASGQLTPEQGRSYEHRNVLLQALGVQPVSPARARAGVAAGGGCVVAVQRRAHGAARGLARARADAQVSGSRSMLSGAHRGRVRGWGAGQTSRSRWGASWGMGCRFRRVASRSRCVVPRTHCSSSWRRTYRDGRSPPE